MTKGSTDAEKAKWKEMQSWRYWQRLPAPAPIDPGSRAERRRHQRDVAKAMHAQDVRVAALVQDSKRRSRRQVTDGARPAKPRRGTFKDWVISTHSEKPDGSRNIDPRDDKFLHSHARAMRGLVKALGRRAAA